MQDLCLFRWAGSKKQILPSLREHAPQEFNRYIEPFAGSAALFFELQPARALISDINEELIETYLQVRKAPAKVASILASSPNTQEEYYRRRALDPKLLSGPERAARFIYLNRYCFNGLYRTNTRGQFNVPYGGYKTGSLPTSAQLLAIADILRRAKIAALDYRSAIRRARKGDFVYLDPPYSIENVRTFNEYDPARFSLDNVKQLRKLLLRLRRRHISFVLSYGESDEAQYLLKGFSWTRVSARRNIAGFAEQRKTAGEIIIWHHAEK